MAALAWAKQTTLDELAVWERGPTKLPASRR
jgi:hypothetical protein